MSETELKLRPCHCGGEMKIEKVAKNGGMDGTYWNWELTCTKCGLTKTYAADGFYGREYKTYEEVVNDWNKKEEDPKIGHWITTRTFMHDGEYYCDRCKCESPNNEKWDYCPNCGRRMV